MGGTTSLGLRYPTMDDTVTAQSWENLAEDIEDQLASLATLAAQASTVESAGVSRISGSVSLASATNGVMTFNSELWDTANLVDLGVDNDRFTLTNGVWFARATVYLTGWTTMATMRVGLLLGGTLMETNSVDTQSTINSAYNSASGVVVVTGGTATLQARIRWQGTGSPTFTAAWMDAYKIRDLADVS